VAVGLALVLTLAANAAVVVARSGEGGSSTVQAGSAQSASVGLGEIDERSTSTITVDAGAAPSTTPLPVGERSTTSARPRVSTTTTARPPASTTTTVKAAEGIDGPGMYVLAPDGTGVRKLASPWGMYSWSPDGSKLAVASGSTLRIVAVDGSGVTEIAAGAGATLPAWSPDGTRIAFGRSGGTWVVRADGRGGATLVDPAGPVAGWTPDGRLVVITTPESGWSEVVVHEKDGARRVIATDASAAVPPAPSPDGRMVAYLARAITVAAVDGSGSRAITGICCASESSTSPLAWSPDSGRVAYIHYGDVRVAAADGSGDRVLVPDSSAPAWSSDGRLAVIDGSTTRPDGLLHLTLQLIGAGGERRTILDGGPTMLVMAPKWAPNGRLIAAAVNPAGLRPPLPPIP
jgi:Tol biopolymer transport system component